jgi:hypothetical protein
MAIHRRHKLSALRTTPADATGSAFIPTHGALKLRDVRVDTYNLDPRYEGHRLAAYTTMRALKMFVDKWRKVARRSGTDPFGSRQSATIKKKELDAVLEGQDCQARAIVHGAIEDFSSALVVLAERFLKLREWQGTECIVVGGGLRGCKTGQLIIRRAQALLHLRRIRIELRAITAHPDEAAVLGAMHLMPGWMLAGCDAILSADLGGTNLRVGVVRLNLERKRDLSKAEVWKRILWRHGEEKVGRDDVVREIAKAMRKLIGKAEANGLRLSPTIGVASPGFISSDGSIGSGSEVLPGNWRSPEFNLPARIVEQIPSIGRHETRVVLHNDAVVQGLSELPFLGRFRRWGIFTVGTGLGNARFTKQSGQ